MTADNSKIRLGMIGGGQGAFIGEVHRIAARIDDRYTLVAGALSSDPERARESAESLGIAPERCYADFNEMASAEADRDDGIEAAVIVTPNHLHFAPAVALLNAGIHVICDKPLTSSLADAETLAEKARASKPIFAVTYNYSGYPMARQAREMVAAGELGELRLVQVEYPQDWLATEVESEGHKQAVWRTDPARAGAGGCIGDIGTHAFHLAEFISGLQVTDLLADLSCFGQGRELDDNAQVLLRFSNGARGSLWSSQVAIGHENGLRVRLYGDKASLEWFQEDPNELKFTRLGQPPQRLTRGSAAVGATANAATRLPSGHPEGFLEGFGNLYNDLADQITAARHGQGSSGLSLVPTIEDGLRGMKFIDRVVSSSKHGSRWETLD